MGITRAQQRRERRKARVLGESGVLLDCVPARPTRIRTYVTVAITHARWLTSGVCSLVAGGGGAILSK